MKKGLNENMDNTFLAMLFRMRHISRWSLMFNTQQENLMQHTAECAFITHFLAIVGNNCFNKNYNADKLCAYALFHDASEVLTGDMPTPVKYFNEEIKSAYKDIEKIACERLLAHLPPELRSVYSTYLDRGNLEPDERKLIKIADKLCAYLKCTAELNAGNKEFEAASISIRRQLDSIESEELRYFLDNCTDSFTLSLDNLKGAL
ncbi:MAG: 5'-deoxynucleotidase [Oscillospiraceae bacterium]|nr:5'-deoxynucleotidase [Oscillospiraceae bacterium]